MRRTDLGFVVSRALSLWVFTLVLRMLTNLPNFLSMVERARRDIDTFAGQEAAIELMQFVVYVALGTLLWIKANSFGRMRFPNPEPEEAEPRTPDVPFTLAEFRSALLSAFGLMIGVSGLVGVASVVQTKSPIGQSGIGAVLATSHYWRGDGFEALLGALVFIVYTYGPWFRRVFQYRQE